MTAERLGGHECHLRPDDEAEPLDCGEVGRCPLTCR
jgi:hypothetical protein